jgi:biopolymer transport protein TolQ
MNELSLLELFAQATLIVKIVVVILIIASIITWLIIVERYLHFQEAENFNNEFETLFWNTKDVDKLFKSTSSKDQSEIIGIERVFYYSYKENLKLKGLKIDAQTKSENISRSIRIAISKEEGIHAKHLQYLANVGSVSPYIGLFGTVIGIVNAFQGLSDATQATINAVAPGISEALIATALGLFAAIPAVLAFNKFTVSTEAQIKSLSVFGEELVSIFSYSK